MSGTMRMRRQWQIQDGPRGTLRRLRSQLAEDGCTESQVVIAKHLLQEAQESGDWAENTNQAVFWLIKASEYGNDEATQLLCSCLESGTGITEENLTEVKTCLSMSKDERTFRSAARELFAMLTPLGQDFVTTSQLKARICPVTEGYHESTVFDEQHLTEENLAEVASKVAQGDLPSYSLPEDEVLPRRRQRLDVSKNVVVDKLRKGLSLTSSKAMDLVAKHGDAFLLSLLPWNQLKVITLMLLCSLLPFQAIVSFLPVVTFYASFGVMITSTVQMIRLKKQFRVFRLWLEIFQSAHATGSDFKLDTDRVRDRFCRRRMRPYIRFFCATTLLLFVRPLCADDAFFHSEVTAVCGVFSAACLLFLSRPLTPQGGIILGMSSLVFVMRVAHGEQLRPLHQFLSLHFGKISELQFRVYRSVLLSVDTIPCVAALTLIAIAAGTWLLLCNKNNGLQSPGGLFYQALPNLVSLSWIHCTSLFFPRATWTGIAWTSVSLLGVLALPVIVVVVLTCVLSYFLVRLAVFVTSSDHCLPFVVTLGAIAVTTAVKFLVNRRDTLSRGFWKTCFTWLQIALAVYAAMQLAPELHRFTVSSPEAGRESKSLNLGVATDWPTYHSLCHKPAWDEHGMAKVQHLCSHLSGSNVRLWQGQVKEVRVVRVSNRLEEAIELLPGSLGAWIRCIYGTPYDIGCRDEEDEYKIRLCRLFADASARRCHVKHWNRYDFEVSVQMHVAGYWNSAEVVLVADDAFRDFLFRVKVGDDIRFNGTLRGDVGGMRPTVVTDAITCDDCTVDLEPAVGRQPINLNEKLLNTITFIFNGLFYPFLQLNHDQT